MKVFKNPVTGETFEDILAAKRLYCNTHPCTSGGCKFHEATNGGLCTKWAQAHPEEAAELMGLVVEEAEVISAPRLAEVLGVEVGEKFTFYDRELWVDEQGLMHDLDGCVSGYTVCDVVNHPESIIRAPRLTEPEIAIMRAVGAKWVSRDDNCDDGSVDLWGAKPLYGDGMYNNTEDGGLIATIRSSALFPSVNPGDCIGPIDTSTTAKSGN